MSCFLNRIVIFLKSSNLPKTAIFSTPIRNLRAQQLFYEEFGEPVDVVKVKEVEIPKLNEDEVLVRMIAAPVNPADMNTIQGKYPVKITLPSIPGSEGVGEVLEVGPKVPALKPGNRVILAKSANGSWRSVGVFKSKVLRRVPDNLGVIEAATLSVNPCTAYRMLKDFKPVVETKSVVIQNGANSACGQNVIQLCKAWDIPNVNIVRNRPNIDDLKTYLSDLGAMHVLTEEELRTTKIFKEGLVNKPILALNCVGGKSSLEMVRHLQKRGSMVTYGGMSREPVTIPTSAFIFKDLSFFGFWMTAWNDTANIEVKDKMYSDLIELIMQKKLKAPSHKLVKLGNYQEALANALSVTGFIGVKYILDFS